MFLNFQYLLKDNGYVGIGKSSVDEDDLHFILGAEDCELFADGRQKYVKIWAETNPSVAVPIGQWFTMDYYYKEVHEEDGRFWLAMTLERGQRKVVFDVNRITRNTQDPDPDGLAHFNPIKSYTSKGLIQHMSSKGKTLQSIGMTLNCRKIKRRDPRWISTSKAGTFHG